MLRRPPRSTRTDTLFPYTTRFRSVAAGAGWGSGAGRTHETSSGSNDPPGVSPCTSNSDEGVLLQKRHARDILGRLAPHLIASTPSPLSSVLKPAFCRRVEPSFGTSSRRVSLFVDPLDQKSPV